MNKYYEKILPGKSYPLGATRDGQGVNLALCSEPAEKVELCLFDWPDAGRESRTIPLPESTHRVWDAHQWKLSNS